VVGGWDRVSFSSFPLTHVLPPLPRHSAATGYFLCSCDSLKSEHIKLKLAGALVFATILGQVLNMFVVGYLFNGASPLPGHLLIVGPVTSAVASLLIFAVISRTSKTQTLRRLQGKYNNAGKSETEGKAGETKEHQHASRLAKRWVSSRSLGNLPTQDRRAHEAAVSIAGAVLQWKINRFHRTRAQKTFLSRLRVFGGQLVVLVAFYLSFFTMLTFPTLYHGVPGGEGLAALVFPLICHWGMGKQRKLLDQVNPALAPVCSHLHMVITEGLQISLFGLARTYVSFAHTVALTATFGLNTDTPRPSECAGIHVYRWTSMGGREHYHNHFILVTSNEYYRHLDI